MCGVRTTLGSWNSGDRVSIGSASVTSRTAWRSGRCFERFVHLLLANDCAARRVDEGRAALHAAEVGRSDHADGFGKLGRMQGYHVAAIEDFVEGNKFYAQHSRRFRRNVRVIRQNVQVERSKQFREGSGDDAQRDQSDGAAIAPEGGVPIGGVGEIAQLRASSASRA